MRRVGMILAVVLLVLAFLPVPAVWAAEKNKVAVVNLTRVINESDGGKKANADLAALVQAKQTELSDKAQVLEKLKKEYNDQAATLTADAKKAKEDEWNRLAAEYQSASATANADIQKKTEELRRTVIGEIREVLKKISQEEGYLVIEDTAVLPYYDASADISNNVIKRYNETKIGK